MNTTTNTVRERPILFSGPMIRALLAGTKTQTRRVMKPQPPLEERIAGVGVYNPIATDRHGEQHPGPEVFGAWNHDGDWALPCPFGAPGDGLYVVECWRYEEIGGNLGVRLRDGMVWIDAPEELRSHVRERLSRNGGWSRWYGRATPRWASRITLEITGVRVERLHKISNADVIAEGVEPQHVEKNRQFFHKDDVHALAYAEVWESIHGKGSWGANPYVWVVSFKRPEDRR
jgi:hypothetical protein